MRPLQGRHRGPRDPRPPRPKRGPTFGLPTTPRALALYRMRHVIDAQRAPGQVEGLETIEVCGHDRIRVIRRLSGARPLLYRHDPDAIAALVKAERGEA